MYKAIKEIGGYNIGDTVPDDKALLWLSMYDVPQVELVGKDEKIVEDIPEEENNEEDVEKSDASPMIDDYLARNKNVVMSAIKSDSLSAGTLRSLLAAERDNKNRLKIISLLETKLKGVE